MTFRTGYRLEGAGRRRRPFHRLAARRQIPIGMSPPSSTLEFWMPDVLDQNETSSCTGGSTGPAIATAFAAKGTPIGWVPSPRGIYANGRAIDRVPNPGGTLPPLSDDGADVGMVVRGIEEWGIRPMKGPTSSGANYDAEPSNVNNEPTLGELEQESTHIVVGDYSIASSGTQRRNEIRGALAALIPITAAIAGGNQRFQAYSGGVLPALHDELDHYIWLFAYQTQPDGSIVYYGRNSWGTLWGEDGNFRLTEAAVDELGDLVAWDVALKRSP